MSEMDESVEIVVAPVPGELLQFGLRDTWQNISGAWMQHDDQLEAHPLPLLVCWGSFEIVLSKILESPE